TSRNVLRPHIRPQPLNQRHNTHRITSIQSSFNHKQNHLVHLQLHRPHHDLDTVHKHNGHPTDRNRPNNFPEPAKVRTRPNHSARLAAFTSCCRSASAWATICPMARSNALFFMRPTFATNVPWQKNPKIPLKF